MPCTVATCLKFFLLIDEIIDVVLLPCVCTISGLIWLNNFLSLYLPHKDQSYWLPWNNRKHTHVLDQEMIEKYLWDRDDMDNIFVSQRDLNWSFMVMAEKCTKEHT